VTEIQLPAFCGPIDFDMNRDWPCKRLARVYHLHSCAAEIGRERKRLARARSARVKWNLSVWLADAEARLTRYVATWELGTCTCERPAEYATLAEVPLPECTCGT
jgi:hypothetical protein